MVLPFFAVIYVVLSVVITVAFMCIRENYGKLGSNKRARKGSEERELLEDSDNFFSDTSSE